VIKSSSLSIIKIYFDVSEKSYIHRGAQKSVWWTLNLPRLVVARIGGCLVKELGGSAADVRDQIAEPLHFQIVMLSDDTLCAVHHAVHDKLTKPAYLQDQD
jgi:hypothetical protein